MDSEKKYPVIYALHGIGYNEQFMMELVKDLQDEAIVIGIRGDLPFKTGYAYYYLKDYGVPERDLFFNSIEKLLKFIEYTVQTYPIDPQNKYIIGFSQGAILSVSLALVLGETITGIVPMNGYVPDFLNEVYTLKPIDHLSVFLCQGLHDTVFPLKVGQESFDHFREHARDVKYTIYPTEHEISDNNGADVAVWLRQQIKANEQSCPEEIITEKGH
jgi:phospholipase/carboxylesterase